MRHLLAILSLGMLGYGARDFWLHLKNKKKGSLTERRLEVWEGEGGAVPTAKGGRTAQIPPR